MSEFNWWLLIVGLVIGAGLVWLILSDAQRRESRADDEELVEEADWIATTLAEAGQPLDGAEVEQVLRLHRTWLATLPPEEADDWTDTPVERAAAADPRGTTAAGRRPARPSTAADVGYARDEEPGTAPVWSATEPSPRRR